MMKRNEEKVPKFDEIIFADRNKEYGAYVLRKSYKAVTSLSALGTLVICSVIVLLISMTTKPVSATKGKDVIVIIKPETFRPPEVRLPEIKPPTDLVKPQNTTPIVVEDTSIVTNFLPITEALIGAAVNGNPDDTVVYSDPPLELVPEEPRIEIFVEEMPMFPGGNSALLEYIGKNIIYPAEAIENNIEGRVVLKFVVTTDGSVGKIEILKGVDLLLDQEAKRVVGTLPRFKPGKQSGKPVNVWFSVPVLFQLKKN